MFERLKNMFRKEGVKYKEDPQIINIPDYQTRKNKELELILEKLDELLELKELYKDMYDLLIKLSERIGKDSEYSRIFGKDSETSDTKPNLPELSPRLNQIIEYIKINGKASAQEISEYTGLSHNRCSELLNLLFKIGYVDKLRVGHTVYFKLREDV
jgi:predicted HTH transcriptional regulator